MRKIIAIMAAGLTAAAFAPAAAQNIISSFEDAGAWTVAGNDITTHSATADIVVDNSDFTEGSGAIAFTYSYSGNAAFEVGMTKEFNPPLDLSDAMEFSIDIKGDANSQEDIQWYALMHDVHGQAIKYYLGSSYTDTGSTVPVHRPKDGVWKTYTFSLAEVVWQEWGTTQFRPPSLSEIETVTFFLQKNSATDTAATTTVLVDNWRYSTTSSRMTTTVVDDFNYADTPSLLAVWDEPYGGGPSNEATSTPNLTTANTFEGSGALELADITVTAQNWSTGIRNNLASPWDVSGVHVFELAIAGDPDIPESVNLMVQMFDSEGGRGRWWARNTLRTTDWSRILLFTKTDAVTEWGAVNAWDLGGWGITTELVRDDIVRIGISLIDGAENTADTYPWTGTIHVDNFLYHDLTTTEPVETDAQVTAVQAWDLY